MKHHRSHQSKWETGQAYVGTGMGERTAAAKSMEMSVRRAWHFGRLCALYTERVGQRDARRLPAFPTTAAEQKAARLALGDTYWREPVLRDSRVWRWAYRQWLLGNMERSMEVMLDQMPEKNRQRAEKEMS